MAGAPRTDAATDRAFPRNPPAPAIPARRVRGIRVLVWRLLLDSIRSGIPRRHGTLGRMGNLCVVLRREGDPPGRVQFTSRRTNEDAVRDPFHRSAVDGHRA